MTWLCGFRDPLAVSVTEWRAPIGAAPLRWHEYSVVAQDSVSACPEKQHGAVQDIHSIVKEVPCGYIKIIADVEEAA